MLPWTHAAFGYLLLVCGGVVLGRRVSRAELIAVLVATQLPDLVDKPLAWWFAALPSGRSLAHSLLFVVPLVGAVFAVSWHRNHPEVGVAFAVGYASHLLGDTYVALYYWRVEELTFLFWPLLAPYPYDDFSGFLDFASQLEVTQGFLVAGLLSIGFGVVFLVQFIRAPWWHTSRPD